MYGSSTREDMYESMTKSEQEDIVKWREQRATLIQKRVQDEVEAELETQASLLRESAAFLRVKVHSVDPKNGKNEIAILTVWHPSEEQMNLLKEGTVVQIFDLSVRDVCSPQDSHLQLTANTRTIIETCPWEIVSLYERIGYFERRLFTLIDVHMLSHTTAAELKASGQVEFDTAVCLVVAEMPNPEKEVLLHLIDETCLMLRVQCKSLPFTLKNLLEGEENGPVAFVLRDLRLLSFDAVQQCAVAEFTDWSSMVTTHGRIEELDAWAAGEGCADVLAATSRLKIDLPEWEQTEEKRIGIGYIMGLRIEEKSQILYIQVDCCGSHSQEWRLPITTLQQMVSMVSPESKLAVHSPQLENRLEELGALRPILRSKGMLWKFQLSCETIDKTDQACIVTKATPANKTFLGHYYLSLPEQELSKRKKT
jgi:hypothetical protein